MRIWEKFYVILWKAYKLTVPKFMLQIASSVLFYWMRIEQLFNKNAFDLNELAHASIFVFV
jgi:hypothetical protein